VVQESRLTLH